MWFLGDAVSYWNGIDLLVLIGKGRWRSWISESSTKSGKRSACVCACVKGENGQKTRDWKVIRKLLKMEKRRVKKREKEPLANICHSNRNNHRSLSWCTSRGERKMKRKVFEQGSGKSISFQGKSIDVVGTVSHLK